MSTSKVHPQNQNWRCYFQKPDRVDSKKLSLDYELTGSQAVWEVTNTQSQRVTRRHHHFTGSTTWESSHHRCLLVRPHVGYLACQHVTACSSACQDYPEQLELFSYWRHQQAAYFILHISYWRHQQTVFILKTSADCRCRSCVQHVIKILASINLLRTFMKSLPVYKMNWRWWQRSMGETMLTLLRWRLPQCVKEGSTYRENSQSQQGIHVKVRLVSGCALQQTSSAVESIINLKRGNEICRQ